MQHYTLRCKHSCRTYTYCTHGNDDGCSKDYCGECQTAIDNALNKIPKKISKHIDILTDKAEQLRLDSIFDINKRKYEMDKNLEVVSSHSLPTFVPIIANWGYKTVERCYVNRVEYYRCVKDDGTFDIKVAKEYDLIKNEYTGELYVETDKNNGYEYTPVIQSKFPVEAELIPEKPMSPPKADMSFLEYKFKEE
jgi:hypothetical protein